MEASVPEGFVSDGCTLWPDGNYRHCCVKHDYDAFVGVPDSVADTDLFLCVAEAFDPVWAAIMIIGLFLFRPIYNVYKKARDYVLELRRKGKTDADN